MGLKLLFGIYINIPKVVTLSLTKSRIDPFLARMKLGWHYDPNLKMLSKIMIHFFPLNIPYFINQCPGTLTKLVMIKVQKFE